MSHQISIRENGFAEMAYVGDTPWHGLGQQLIAGASIAEWRKAAGMDFEIERTPVRYGKGAAPRNIDSKHVLYRSDNKEWLSIVSDEYKLVQPAEVLDFFKTLVQEAGGFELSTAGVLFEGRKLWAMARVSDPEVIIGRDTVQCNLLLATACDGTMPTIAKFTNVRAVCNNTVTLALNESKKDSVRVSHSTVFKPASVKAKLGIAETGFREFILQARDMANTPVSVSDAEVFVAELLVDSGVSSRSGDAMEGATQSAAFKRILALFSGSGMGSDLESSAGTLWGCVNAVTEYVDHHKLAKNNSIRINKAWFGDGDDLKTAAFEKALTL